MPNPAFDRSNAPHAHRPGSDRQAPAEEPSQLPPRRANPAPAEAVPRRESEPALRALVVEDDPGVRAAVARILAGAGFSVQVAEDGDEALQWLEQQGYEVILSDINMPKADGMTLLSRVREQDRELPVILMTGMPSLDTAIRAVDDGAFQYVTKPFDPQELCDAATRAAGYYRMTQLKQQAAALSGGAVLSPQERRALEARFARALGTLQMAYQPIVRAADGTPVAYETLMRPQDRAFPHPGALLDAAEQLQRLEDVGRRTRELAAATMTAAPERGLLFINLHPEDLLDEDLYREDAPLTRIAPQVVLEITERASLAEIGDVGKRIHALRALGFRIAVDDLGAGYAGLSSFAVLQPEFVKLDMSLVRDVDSSPLKKRLVRSMTETCRELGIQVICEGVETHAEWAALRDLDAGWLQGYLFARPGPPFPEILV
jgi:EAL domain-containing protein (putative c-di-GMP-specific phosphodiesterase class I)